MLHGPASPWESMGKRMSQLRVCAAGVFLPKFPLPIPLFYLLSCSPFILHSMFVVLGFKGCWTSGLNYSLLLCSKWEFINKAIFFLGGGQQVDPPNSKISWLHARLRMDQHLISSTNIHLTFLKCHRSYCMETRSHQTTLAVGSDRHMHAATRPLFSTVLFSRPPFWMLMLSVFLPLSISLALPDFRGTWRGIRQGSETDCNSSVHFSAASSEPGSRRWPSWALRSWAALHGCILPALLRGTLGGGEPDLRLGTESVVEM